MRWLGQAQRAFDLMCNRLNTRMVRGEPLGRKQLMQKHVFDSYAEIQVRVLGGTRGRGLGERREEGWVSEGTKGSAVRGRRRARAPTRPDPSERAQWSGEQGVLEGVAAWTHLQPTSRL